MGFSLSGAISGAFTGFSMGGPWGAVAGFFIGGFGVGDMQRRARNRARDAFNRAQRDRQFMVQSATAPHQVVYGRARVSGPLVFAHSSGADKEFLHMVVALAGHECDAIETVYLGDTALALDADGWATNDEFSVTKRRRESSQTGIAAGQVKAITLPHTPTRVTGVTIEPGSDNGSYAPVWSLAGNVVTVTATDGGTCHIQYERIESVTRHVRVRRWLGTSTQAADTVLVSESDGKWTSAHRLRGICYLYVRLQYHADMFSGGRPDVSAVVRGRKVVDPRLGYPVWTDNAALCVADYLRSYMGASSAETPNAEVSAAADICDQTVSLDAFGATQRRYTCNGVLGTDAAPRENLESLVEAMAGSVTWVQGRYLIRAGAHRAAEMTITESMLADDPVVIQAGTERGELVNRIIPSYQEPQRGYTTVEAPPVTNALYVSADGGLDLPLECRWEMCDDSRRAQRLAKIALERSRQGLRVQITCNLAAYDLAPGSVVALTLARYGWAGKLFEVVERRHDLRTQTVGLSLQETAAGVWDWAHGEATTVDLSPNTSLPSPWARPPEITGLAAATGTAHLLRTADGSIQCRARVTWDRVPDTNVQQGGQIRIQWRQDKSEWVEGAALPGDATEALIGPLAEGVGTVIGVLPVTQLRKTAPQWTFVHHIPVGESAPPANVTGLAAGAAKGGLIPVSWAPCAEADYQETELRVGASWAASALLFVGAAASCTWSPDVPGSYALWAKHRDRSGNESAAAASLAVTVTAADISAAVNYDVEIESTNGTEFRVGQGTQTLLKAHVFRNDSEVTQDIPESWFRWRRVSLFPQPPPNDDATWNAAYASGYRQVNVSVDDVASKATFFCDIVRPD